MAKAKAKRKRLARRPKRAHKVASKKSIRRPAVARGAGIAKAKAKRKRPTRRTKRAHKVASKKSIRRPVKRGRLAKVKLRLAAPKPASAPVDPFPFDHLGEVGKDDDPY